MKYPSEPGKISSIILLQNQSEALKIKTGGDIYINSFPSINKAQLAIIDTDSCSNSYKIKSGVSQFADCTLRESFSLNWEEYIDYARAQLNDSGLLALIASAQESADFRLVLDKVFGKDKMVNQIIWHYSLPGSAKRHFLKRHSIIYIYSKTSKYYINTLAAGRKRCQNGRVHLKKQADENGRGFYQISRGNKILKYDVDSLIPFDDVWNIPQISSKSAENEGCPGQKPRELTDRLILCLSKPGDIIMDYGCPGSTALMSACENGRNFVEMAYRKFDAHISIMRLLRAGCPYLNIHGAILPSKKVVSLNTIDRPDCREIYLDGYGRFSGCSPQDGLDNVDIWAVGQIRENTFISDNFSLRSKQESSLKRCLRIQREKDNAIYISDVYGKEKFILL